MTHTDPSAAGGASPRPVTVVAVSGNPRVGSRTLGAATAVAARIADLLGAEPGPTIDLAELAPEILTADHPATDRALTTLASASVAVVATPVYKASYTGLLKAFLDLYGPDGLAGVVVVPVTVSGNPGHALAGEVHLRPVLVELGATVPTRALSITESQLGDLDVPVTAWLDRATGALSRAVGVPARALEGAAS